MEILSRATVQELNYSEPAKTSVGNTTTEIAAANTSRRYLSIVNDSNEAVYLGIGEDAVMNKGIRINANGGAYEMLGLVLSFKAINGICLTGAKDVGVQEATI